MKRSFSLFSTTYAVLVLLLVVSGCSPFSERTSGRRYQILWPNADGSYEIQRVQLDTFTDPQRLKGDAATLIVEPRLGPRGLEGERPVGRFIETKDGTLIPADLVTHQAVVVYAHMERLRQLDQTLDVGGSGFLWPARIGIRANVVDNQGLLQNNAIYDGSLNALLLVPYTDTDLPITLNGGVLAHERFHAIFQHYVLSRLGSKWQVGRDGVGADAAHVHVCGLTENEEPELKVTRSFPRGSRGDKLAREVSKVEYNRFLVRGLNEGLADFWGWIYSGDPAFIRKSLRTVGSVRSLNLEMDPLLNREMIRANLSRVTDARPRSSLAYTFGSGYARFLLQLVRAQAAANGTDEKTAQMEVARALVEALPKIGDSFEAAFDSEFIAPDVALKPLLMAMKSVGVSTCDVYEKFLGASNAATLERPEVCPRPPNPQPPALPELPAPSELPESTATDIRAATTGASL